MLKSKVVLLGNSTVGKTSILNQFKLEKFNNCIDSTIGCEFFAKSVFCDEKEIKLLLWDTAGQEVFHSFTQNFLRGARLVLIIFDVSNYASFLSLEHWLNETKKTSSKMNIVIVGNKNDLRSEISDEDMKTFIQTYQEKYNFDYYGTITAKKNENVNELFHFIGEKLIKNIECFDEEINYNLNVVNLDDPLQNSNYCCT